MQYFTPMFNFNSPVQYFIISDYFVIQKVKPINLNMKSIDSSIRECNKIDINLCDTWGIINEKKPIDILPQIIFNNFALAVWMVVPTWLKKTFSGNWENGQQILPQGILLINSTPITPCTVNYPNSIFRMGSTIIMLGKAVIRTGMIT